METPVGVVRVYESTDSPHIVLRTGAVFVRETAGDTDVARWEATRRGLPPGRCDRDRLTGANTAHARILALAQPLVKRRPP
jgi:hypothetical protein